MNELATRGAFAAQVEPLNAESWSAWKLGERESDPLEIASPATLDEAVAQALAGIAFYRGDTLAVLFTHAGRRKQTLWLYTIKQESKASYRRDPASGATVREQRLYPVMVCETAVQTFAPVERWRVPPNATPAEIVGLDRTLVEQR